MHDVDIETSFRYLNNVVLKAMYLSNRVTVCFTTTVSPSMAQPQFPAYVISGKTPGMNYRLIRSSPTVRVCSRAKWQTQRSSTYMTDFAMMGAVSLSRKTLKTGSPTWLRFILSRNTTIRANLYGGEGSIVEEPINWGAAYFHVSEHKPKSVQNPSGFCPHEKRCPRF